jgi:hypothetical protein
MYSECEQTLGEASATNNVCAGGHPRSQGLTADTALPAALAKTKTGTSKIL